MRLNRGTLIFLGGSLLIIVVALVLLNAPASAPDDDTSDEGSPSIPQALFADLAAEDIQTLQVRDNATQSSITIQRVAAEDEDASDTWAIEGAMGEPDVTAVERAVENFAVLRAAEAFTLADENTALADYGLDAPAHTLIAQSTDETFTLQIGDQSFDGNRFYALLGEDETTVYQLSGVTTVNGLTALSTQPPLMPTPTPTPVPVLNIPGVIFPNFAPDTITALTVTGDGTTFSAEKADDTWTAAEGTLDPAQMAILISSFGTLNAVDAIEGADLANLGLDEPAYTITLAGTATFTLQIGNLDASGTRYYALVNDFDTVAVVDQAQITPFLALLDAPPEATAESTAEANE